MDQKAKTVLEFHKIIQRLSELAGSQLARQLIMELEPSQDSYVIKDLLAETSEALSVIVKKGPLPLGNFYDIQPYLELSRKGGTLAMRQLLEVLYNVNIAAKVISFMKGELPEVPIIKGMTELLEAPKVLRDEIDRCILSEEDMADDASPQLKNLRRSIERQNEAVRNRINQILNKSDNRSYLQDAIVTLRQGRYVIPVKQEHRTRFPGIVHDQSSSGATLFIEPQVVVDLNNQLRELELAEQGEVQRVLAELSAMVAQWYHPLSNNQKLLVQLDVIFAKGHLSYEMDGTEPIITEEGTLHLLSARHPFIDPKQVVPVTITLDKGTRSLIITGPNTGGKTVTLKTTGLLVLMAQSGLHVPAVSGTQIPVFRKIYADIGDEQSIEQSLSTFSSHMNNIVRIVKNCDEKTLILLDELGAGTDPTEGAALAIAILKNLSGKGATVLATTHYTELKKYALSMPGVENASMEFNVETLSPTYHMTMGIPGRSNAFEIAEKLGLPGELIVAARGLLDENALAFEEVITSLNEEKRAISEMKDEALLLNLAVKKQQQELAGMEEKLNRQREKILEEAKEQARFMVEETREELSRISREAQERSERGGNEQNTQEFQPLKSQLKTLEDRFRERKKVPENLSPTDPAAIRLGQRVRVLTLDQIGEVLTLPDDKGELMVQVGRLKVSVKIRNVIPISENRTPKPKSPQRFGDAGFYKARSCPITINVQGETLDTASMMVDKYLDDAYMAGLKTVSVIHGRGEGILRKGIHEMLKRHKHVTSYQRAGYNEGGDGVTVVILREK
jgi:DNA mismatch repair protein MutS2